MRGVLVVALGVGVAAGSCGEESRVYDVRIGFNESVTQGDMDEVHAFLRVYDEDVDFLIQESFPPTGVALVETDDEGFCNELSDALADRAYVRDIACGRAEEPPAGGDPEEPVSSTPDG